MKNDKKTEEMKTQSLRIMITIRLMLWMTIRVEMMIMMTRLIDTDDKNYDSYKNDDK